jgi:hypothetical protein
MSGRKTLAVVGIVTISLLFAFSLCWRYRYISHQIEGDWRTFVEASLAASHTTTVSGAATPFWISTLSSRRTLALDLVYVERVPFSDKADVLMTTAVLTLPPSFDDGYTGIKATMCKRSNVWEVVGDPIVVGR